MNVCYCRAVARLGEHDISTTTEAEHVDIPIKQKITHPNYDKKDGHTDIAILVLDGEISYTSKIVFFFKGKQ
jgi:Trypsin